MIYNADLNEGFFNSFFYLNKYYGITKNPITNDFIIIMKYYELGSLKDYITKNFYSIKWNEKSNILRYIAKGLDHIHNQKIIHRDFHSGNILYDDELVIKICKGFRPPITTSAPKDYIELMQECWNSDPNKRPIANDISNIFDFIIIPNYNNE